MANSTADPSIRGSWAHELADPRSTAAVEHLQRLHDQPDHLRASLLARDEQEQEQEGK
jgi:hypothetical protein